MLLRLLLLAAFMLAIVRLGAHAAVPGIVSDLRPASGAHASSVYPQIFARLDRAGDAIEPATVRVYLDHVDVSGDATISAAYASYVPTSALAAGGHEVRIEGLTEDGRPFERTWSFSVGGGIGTPGDSLYVPGRMYYAAGQTVEVILETPDALGHGYVSAPGIDDRARLEPVDEAPGFYYARLRVPLGCAPGYVSLRAHFTTRDGRARTIDAAAPLRVYAGSPELPDAVRHVVSAASGPFTFDHRPAIAARAVSPPAQSAPDASNATDESASANAPAAPYPPVTFPLLPYYEMWPVLPNEFPYQPPPAIHSPILLPIMPGLRVR